MNQYLEINEEVKEALKNNQAVVALESTIISHGMPYPQNVQTARRVEEIVREQGAVPATIAVIGGKLKVGLTDEELEFFGQSSDILKASRRDLPFIVAGGLHGATTVATTMIIAQMAGIKVFVTGGIGGVHRGASETFDISADLQELAKTDVAVVCAGVKSILDIGLTLEYLETQGVPVLGYQTKDFPAFYTRESGYQVLYSLDDAEVAAKTLKVKWDMDLKGGLVIANPVPEAEAMDASINEAIEASLKECDEKGIKGKDITPFLLGRIKEVTEGRSLETNIALVYNNARVGGQIAKAYSLLNK
ncbi:pseudouridine-5'-phosphate glycosidase [Acidaminobacter sp. JC074]|uniref:pseudouridine-5'-phosphate glycosidase n=1 Tax=Acidaminobacter sp. JC074 TaxID=2530199 RepID=UPI001F0DE77E|nr:pseudouridine-5'-phosphate glycosidase [Acidaminobacter sp. JC074]